MSQHVTKSLMTRASALLAGRWVQDALRLVIFLWLARTMVEGYGLFIFAVGVSIIMRAPLYLDQFTVRELTADHRSQGAVLAQMLRFKTLLGTLMLCGLTAFGLIKGWDFTQMVVVVVVSLNQIMESVANTVFSLHRTQGRQVQEFTLSSLAYLVGAAYGALALWMHWHIVVVVLFLLIASGLKIGLAMYSAEARGGLSQVWSRGPIWPRGHVWGLLAIMAISLLGATFNNVQIFLLKQFRLLTEVAYYGVTTELAGGVAGLVSTLVIGGVLYPVLTQAVARGPAALARATQAFFWQMVAYGLAVAFFFATLGADLMYLLYGPKYAPAEVPLQIMGLAVLFSFINNLLNHALLAQGREKLVLAFYLVPVVLSVVLGLVTIPSLGPEGAALNLLACRVALSVLVVGYAQRRFGVLKWSRCKPVLIGALILAAGYAGFLWLKQHFYLHRGLALLCLGVYFWWLWRWTRGAGPDPAPEAPAAGEGA